MANGSMLLDRLAARLSRRLAVGGLLASLLGQDPLDSRTAAARDQSGPRPPRHPARQRRRSGAKHRAAAEIVGGTEVPAGAYPFQVALIDHRYGKKRFRRQFCAGSLLDASHVLTAAHCVKGRDTSNPRNLRIAVGLTALNRDAGQARDVVSISIHPDYNAKTFRNDAAVLRLAEPVDLTTLTPIRPAGPADAALESPGTALTIIGWGSTRPHLVGKKAKNKPPKYAHSLRQAQVTVVDDAQCVSDFSGKHITKVVPAVMLCAGQPGRDTCTGDSGGPLFAELADGVVQVGIVSWGVGCAADRPGIYTRVSALAAFIEQSVAAAPP